MCLAAGFLRCWGTAWPETGRAATAIGNLLGELPFASIPVEECRWLVVTDYWQRRTLSRLPSQLLCTLFSTCLRRTQTASATHSNRAALLVHVRAHSTLSSGTSNSRVFELSSLSPRDTHVFSETVPLFGESPECVWRSAFARLGVFWRVLEHPVASECAHWCRIKREWDAFSPIRHSANIRDQ